MPSLRTRKPPARPLTDLSAANGKPTGLPRAPAAEPPGRRRRPKLAAAGVAVVVLGGLMGAFLFSALGAQASVIGVAAPVAFGEQIEASDLVEVSAADDPGLDPIPYADVEQVIGMTAATDLIVGSLLTMGALTEDPIPGPGQELVPIALQTSQLPATGLRPRDEVLFVETAAGDGQAATSGQGDSAPAPVAQTSTGTVLRVGQPSTTGVVVVDVLVDSGDGVDLAQLASNGRIALVVLPWGG